MMKKLVVFFISVTFAACSNSSNNPPLNETSEDGKKDTLNVLSVAILEELNDYSIEFGDIKNPGK